MAESRGKKARKKTKKKERTVGKKRVSKATARTNLS
jgi:hypothetical protein